MITILFLKSILSLKTLKSMWNTKLFETCCIFFNATAVTHSSNEYQFTNYFVLIIKQPNRDSALRGNYWTTWKKDPSSTRRNAWGRFTWRSTRTTSTDPGGNPRRWSRQRTGSPSPTSPLPLPTTTTTPKHQRWHFTKLQVRIDEQIIKNYHVFVFYI